jgi:cell division protein FtsL
MTPPAAAAAPAVRPRRAPAPRGPRRVSGPARPTRPTVAPRPSRSRARPREDGLALGFAAALRALARHRLLDRLIRGRAWIFVIAFALIGVVALQLGLLKLNGGIGRALEREAMLQTQNSALSVENSELAAGERVEARAGKLGMTFAPAGAMRFLSAGGHGEAAKAAGALASAAREKVAKTSEASSATASSTATASSSEASGEGETEASASTAESESSTSGETASSSSSSAPAPTEAASTASAPPSEATHEVGGGEAQPSGGSEADASGG